MAFGFPETSAKDFLPIIKFDSKDGKITKVDRVQGSQGWTKEETEITATFSAVMDFEYIQVGWIYFSMEGPKRVMVTYQKAPTPEQPQDRDEKGSLLYRQGFTIQMALAKSLGGGVYEMSGSSKGLVSAMGVVSEAFIAAPESKQGKLPIVVLASCIKADTSFGKFYRPTFEIKGWVDRPTALAVQNGATATYATEPVAKASVADNYATVKGVTPPATGSTQVAAPPPPPAGQLSAQRQPEPVGSGDFG